MTDKVEIGNATLYCGDCMDILPTLGKVDAVITDPPYGIGESAGKNKSRGKIAKARDYGDDGWDNEPICDDLLKLILNSAKWQVIFGGNYYALPPTSCVLVWHKDNGASDFADCELAWTNLKKAVRYKRYRWAGMLQENMARKETRQHPTQKPVPVMEWCISHCPDANLILDPFMGSGTTGVACMNMGKQFIGIEREQKYFDIACERIENSQAQGRLFA